MRAFACIALSLLVAAFADLLMLDESSYAPSPSYEVITSSVTPDDNIPVLAYPHRFAFGPRRLRLFVFNSSDVSGGEIKVPNVEMGLHTAGVLVAGRPKFFFTSSIALTADIKFLECLDARCQSWATGTLLAGVGAQGIKAVAPDSIVQIFYQFNGTALHHLACESAFCLSPSERVIDNTTTTGFYLSLAQRNNLTLLAYTDYTLQLYLYFCADAQCSSGTRKSLGGTVSFINVAYRIDGTPLVFGSEVVGFNFSQLPYGPGNGNGSLVRYACDSPQCDTFSKVNFGIQAIQSAVGVRADGLPFVAHTPNGAHALLASCDSPNCNSLNDSALFQSGGAGITLQFHNNFPLVTCQGPPGLNSWYGTLRRVDFYLLPQRPRVGETFTYDLMLPFESPYYHGPITVTPHEYPSWAGYDPVTHIINGTTPEDQGCEWNITFTVTDTYETANTTVLVKLFPDCPDFSSSTTTAAFAVITSSSAAVVAASTSSVASTVAGTTSAVASTTGGAAAAAATAAAAVTSTTSTASNAVSSSTTAVTTAASSTTAASTTAANSVETSTIASTNAATTAAASTTADATTAATTAETTAATTAITTEAVTSTTAAAESSTTQNVEPSSTTSSTTVSSTFATSTTSSSTGDTTDSTAGCARVSSALLLPALAFIIMLMLEL